MMDVRIEPETAKEGSLPNQIYGYAIQLNAGMYVVNRGI